MYCCTRILFSINNRNYKYIYAVFILKTKVRIPKSNFLILICADKELIQNSLFCKIKRNISLNFCYYFFIDYICCGIDFILDCLYNRRIELVDSKRIVTVIDFIIAYLAYCDTPTVVII